MVGRGDFNLKRSEEENLRELPVTVAETEDFNHCISMWNLEECVYQGNKYTWWNVRTDEECIFKRLNKVMSNEKM